jgi:hypothetical protein
MAITITITIATSPYHHIYRSPYHHHHHQWTPAGMFLETCMPLTYGDNKIYRILPYLPLPSDKCTLQTSCSLA